MITFSNVVGIITVIADTRKVDLALRKMIQIEHENGKFLNADLVGKLIDKPWQIGDLVTAEIKTTTHERKIKWRTVSQVSHTIIDMREL